MTVVHDPGGTGFYIERLWAFVSVHDDGDEGVVGASIGGMMLPLVAADQARLAQYRPYAAEVARLTGKPVRLVRFDRRTDIETFPAGPPARGPRVADE